MSNHPGHSESRKYHRVKRSMLVILLRLMGCAKASLPRVFEGVVFSYSRSISIRGKASDLVINGVQHGVYGWTVIFPPQTPQHLPELSRHVRARRCILSRSHVPGHAMESRCFDFVTKIVVHTRSISQVVPALGGAGVGLRFLATFRATRALVP